MSILLFLYYYLLEQFLNATSITGVATTGTITGTVRFPFTDIHAPSKLKRLDFHTSVLRMISFTTPYSKFVLSLMILHFLVKNLESLTSFNKSKIFIKKFKIAAFQ